LYNRNYITIYFLAVVLFALTQFYLAYFSAGGIDIAVYWGESVGIDYRNPRYYQEPVSWEIIRILATSLSRENFVFGFSLSVLAIGIARLGFFGGLVLYASFLSPFGVMLEFNILRQCLGTIFLIFFTLSLVRDKRWSAGLWGIMAILSHNSTVVMVGFLAFIFYFSRFDRTWKFIASLALVAFIVIMRIVGGLEVLLGSRTESFMSTIVDDGPENLVYLAFSLVFCVLLYIFSKDGKWRPIALALAISTVFTVAVALILSLDSWVYGRMAISCVVVCHFLLAYDFWERRHVRLLDLFFVLGVMTLNGAVLFFHPGAMTMITGRL